MLLQLWRILATGFSFAFFSIGGLLLSSILFPIIRLLSPDKVICYQRIQMSICMIFRFFVGLNQLLGVASFSKTGIEKLKEDKGTIIVANHPSLIDIVLLGSVLERFDCIVKESLWHSWFLQGVVKAAAYIPNRSGEQLISDCQQRLSQGGNLVIFPEGTRTTPGQPIKLQRGSAQIALRTLAPIRVVHISCHPTTFTKGDKWYHVPKKRPHFQLIIGELIDSKKFLDGDVEYSIAARRLTRYLTQALMKDTA